VTVMKLGMYGLFPEAILMAYFINASLVKLTRQSLKLLMQQRY
jgi:hypothetical protein